MSQNQIPPTASQNNEPVDLGRLFGILIDHGWLIIFITSIFVIAGVAYAMLSTPIYRADALVQVEQASPGNPLADVNSLLGKEPPSQAEIEIIRSRMVLGKAVDILNLDLQVEPKRLPVIGGFLSRIGIERPGFMAGWGYAWAGETMDLEAMPVADKYLGETFTLQVIDARHFALFYDGEQIGEGRVGSASEFLGGDVSVSVAAIDAPPGAKFLLTHISRLMAIVELRDNFSIAERGKETGILNWGLTHQDPKLAQTILRTITDIYLAQNIQRQSEEARKSLEFLTGQLPAVRMELSSAEDLLNTYRITRDSVDLTLETQSVLERLVNIEAKLNELAFSEAEISRRFKPSHPTYSALIEKKQQLQEERSNIESKIDNLPETQQEILRLQRDVSVNQEIYVQLRNKVQEMQIAEASTVGNVRVLDNAEVFPKPVKPQKKVILILATLLGGMIAVGFVFVRALLKRGVETQDQLESLGLAVYATVPRSEEQEKLNRRVKLRNGRSRTASEELLAQRNPADLAIEALRGLRTSLHFSMMEGANNRVMITGPSPGIGKSFITVNLAAVCAQMGQRVLVVDGDMRKGRIHTVFGEQSEGGLSEVLSGQQKSDTVIRSVKSMENLNYVSRGVAPPNPSELLATIRFREFLDSVDQLYDLVIIDSPPVLAVTDATIIGKLTGTTLMVARFQLNPLKEIELAVHRLETGGVKVKGAILNALERTAAGAYGYGYYTYVYK